MGFQVAGARRLSPFGAKKQTIVLQAFRLALIEFFISFRMVVVLFQGNVPVWSNIGFFMSRLARTT